MMTVIAFIASDARPYPSRGVSDNPFCTWVARACIRTCRMLHSAVMPPTRWFLASRRSMIHRSRVRRAAGSPPAWQYRRQIYLSDVPLAARYSRRVFADRVPRACTYTTRAKFASCLLRGVPLPPTPLLLCLGGANFSSIRSIINV